MELEGYERDDRRRGKHKFGARAVANKYNDTVLSSPNDRKIARETLWRCNCKWVTDGKKTDGKGYPEPSKPDSKTILNVLLSRVDPSGLRSKYSSMSECRKWLGELKSGTTWDTEMEQVKNEYTSVLLKNRPRLF